MKWGWFDLSSWRFVFKAVDRICSVLLQSIRTLPKIMPRNTTSCLYDPLSLTKYHISATSLYNPHYLRNVWLHHIIRLITILVAIKMVVLHLLNRLLSLTDKSALALKCDLNTRIVKSVADTASCLSWWTAWL